MIALSRLFSAGPVPRGSIALFFADRFRFKPTVNGYMFDLDKRGPLYGPRQGCVLFLRSIAQAASGWGRSFEDFAAFTAIHELGHAFNLWHEHGSFMDAAPDEAFPSNARFSSRAIEFLGGADDPDQGQYVVPGESNFGARGAFVVTDDGKTFAKSEKTSLRLGVKITHDQFWFFEPVEIELELKARGRAVTVPDELDPAYETFQIWITQPDGERRQYRASKQMCRPGTRLRIAPGEPFTRDISLIVQKGDYTFRTAGTYDLEVIFRLSSRRVVRSNLVRFEVLPFRPDLSSFSELRSSLERASVLSVLRFRQGLKRPLYEHLCGLLESSRRAPTTASLHYILAKTLLGPDRKQPLRPSIRQMAARHLERAGRSPYLGPHRKRAVEVLLDEIDRA